MEPHAHSAVSANTKQNRGRLIALIVHQTLSLHLAVSHTPTVNVTLVILEKMEAHALCVRQESISMDWGEVLV